MAESEVVNEADEMALAADSRTVSLNGEAGCNNSTAPHRPTEAVVSDVRVALSGARNGQQDG
eukprot:scaffold454698_cov17-Prasinocladus_malaysianus.AAC.1